MFRQIDRARRNALYFEWVGADSLYGRDYGFAMTLDGWGETFVLDVPGNYWVYENYPCPKIPSDPTTGRKRKRYVSVENPIKVRQWLKQQDQTEWRTHSIRKGTKGPIKGKVLHKKVWIWDGKSSEVYCWHVICRTNLEGGELKMSISNAPDAMRTKQLVYMQSQRHFVERAFQDAKSELGLAQYQARGWQSWHQHASLVMMAMLFFLKEKTYMREELPFITVADLVMYFAMAIPDRKSTHEGLMEILERRNEERRKAHARKYGTEQPHMGVLA